MAIDMEESRVPVRMHSVHMLQIYFASLSVADNAY